MGIVIQMPPSRQQLKLFLCGDVMTGRGIDQVLAFPCDPVLYEPYVRDARDYVAMAESVNGAIPRRSEFAYLWGDALGEWQRRSPDIKIINLETSVTRSADYWRHKGIHYRMSPENFAAVTAANIDCCVLANNHVLDWGRAGLVETLEVIERAGVHHAGAGSDASRAAAPAAMDVPYKGRVLVFAFGAESSGIPPSWAATAFQSGVNFLNDLSAATVMRIKREIDETKRPGDIVVASIHWGGNWGYEIEQEHIHFAHALIDIAGVDIIHGHSSHHVKAIEVYHQRLILYGCGDFLNDYEGIGGYDNYRPELALMYFATIDPRSGELSRLDLVPTRTVRFRIIHASRSEALWLKDMLHREGARFHTWTSLSDDNSLTLQWH